MYLNFFGAMMLTDSDIDDATIYKEESGPLASRIDFAWKVYQEKNEAKQYRYNEATRKKALEFLIYTFNIKDTYHINLQVQFLTELMRGREDATPEDNDYYRYFPEKSPNVYIHQGLFKKNEKPFDTREMHCNDRYGVAAFTFNKQRKEFSVFNHEGMEDGIADTERLAGEIEITDGRLKSITTDNLFNTYSVLQHFIKQGVDISEAEVITRSDPSEALGISREQPPPTDYYKIPAPQLFNRVNTTLNEKVNLIEEEIKKYQEERKGKWTEVLKLKDKMLGSSLTEGRIQLANDLSKALTKFKQTLNNGRLSLTEFEVKTDELDEIISSFNKANRELSSDCKKNIESGRLASAMKIFKEKCDVLKGKEYSKLKESQEGNKKEREEGMKKIY